MIFMDQRPDCINESLWAILTYSPDVDNDAALQKRREDTHKILKEIKA